MRDDILNIFFAEIEYEFYGTLLKAKLISYKSYKKYLKDVKGWLQKIQ